MSSLEVNKDAVFVNCEESCFLNSPSWEKLDKKPLKGLAFQKLKA